MRLVLLLLVIEIAGCSSGTPARDVKVYGAGEKASVDHLTYSIIDTEIQPRLGDDAGPRIPQSRFFLIQLSVSNGGNSGVTIPSMSLVDDSGKAYPELADGTGVQQWLGVVRKVDGGQTEQGYVIFDAPTGHYKLKLNDDTSDSDVYADIPLSFVHERMTDAATSAIDSGRPAAMDKVPGDKTGKK